jgi:hypothetical protein
LFSPCKEYIVCSDIIENPIVPFCIEENYGFNEFLNGSSTIRLGTELLIDIINVDFACGYLYATESWIKFQIFNELQEKRRRRRRRGLSFDSQCPMKIEKNRQKKRKNDSDIF